MMEVMFYELQCKLEKKCKYSFLLVPSQVGHFLIRLDIKLLYVHSNFIGSDAYTSKRYLLLLVSTVLHNLYAIIFNS